MVFRNEITNSTKIVAMLAAVSFIFVFQEIPKMLLLVSFLLYDWLNFLRS